MLKQQIGFIGAGQMATALGQGLAGAKLVASAGLKAADPSPEARKQFAKATGGKTTGDNRQVVEESDVIFLAVKPQMMAEILAEIRSAVTPDKLVVSIAAGVRLGTLEEGLGDKVRLVRVMPNAPCLVGRGACGFCLGKAATDDDGQLVHRLLAAVGIAVEVEEKLLDAVTGLSGSGPAFVFVVIEALSDGGVRAGLPRSAANTLAIQTVLGAAEMALATGEHPAVLKDRVTSPGGTTIAGLAALESGGLRAALFDAVDAAARRSEELGSRASSR